MVLFVDHSDTPLEVEPRQDGQLYRRWAETDPGKRHPATVETDVSILTRLDRPAEIVVIACSRQLNFKPPRLRVDLFYAIYSK
jgi:hypothetical protein